MDGITGTVDRELVSRADHSMYMMVQYAIF